MIVLSLSFCSLSIPTHGINIGTKVVQLHHLHFLCSSPMGVKFGLTYTTLDTTKFCEGCRYSTPGGTYILRCMDETKFKTHATPLSVALVVFKLEAIQRVNLQNE